MRKEEIQKAFSEVQKLSANNLKLTTSIEKRLTDLHASVIPVKGLRSISFYFAAYMAFSFFLYLLITNLVVVQPQSVFPEELFLNTSEAISAGVNGFFYSYGFINSFINGIFFLFFKISGLAFIFAAASMNAESSEMKKGELSCAN